MNQPHESGHTSTVEEISIPPNFGLAYNEPLTVEGIVSAAFANPDRAQLPECARKYWSWIEVSHNLTCQTILQRLKSEGSKCVAKFDAEEIKLHDMKELNLSSDTQITEQSGENEQVNPAEYMETINNSVWFGPFKHPGQGQDSLKFFAVSITGDSDLIVEFAVDLPGCVNGVVVYLQSHKKDTTFGLAHYHDNK